MSRQAVIARSEATKQSISPLPARLAFDHGEMDCFASLAMTGLPNLGTK